MVLAYQRQSRQSRRGSQLIHITPHTVEAAYELLRTTPPFRGWKLPPADEVEFIICFAIDYRAQHQYLNGRHKIWVSARNVGSLQELTRVMAHEMIHVHEERTKQCRYDVLHSKKFQQWAKRVCQLHCWDLKMF